MNHAFELLEKSAPAGGQTQRLPGSTRAAALHDQLYRYAEDLQQMAALRENSRWQGEVSNRRKNGEIYPLWMTVNAARDADGSVLAYIAVFADLARLRGAESRLADLAWRDTPVPPVCVDRLSERPHAK